MTVEALNCLDKRLGQCLEVNVELETRSKGVSNGETVVPSNHNALEVFSAYCYMLRPFSSVHITVAPNRAGLKQLIACSVQILTVEGSGRSIPDKAVSFSSSISSCLAVVLEVELGELQFHLL